MCQTQEKNAVLTDSLLDLLPEQLERFQEQRCIGQTQQDQHVRIHLELMVHSALDFQCHQV